MDKKRQLIFSVSLILSFPCILFSSPLHIIDNNSFNKKPNTNFYKHKKHLPDKELISINSYSEEINRRLNLSKKKDPLSMNYIYMLEKVVSENYIHEALTYRCKDHWLGCLLQKTGLPKFKHLLRVLNPDHIVLAKHGQCNQQAILVQEILKHDGHNYASIRISSKTFGHFTSAAFIDNRVYFLDTNIYPGHINDGNLISRILSKNSKFANKLYSKWTSETDLKISISDFSSFPARNGLLFQEFIFILEKWIWLIPLIFIIKIKKPNYKNKT